jgi:hypothetical protein
MNQITPIAVGTAEDETITVYVGDEKSRGWRKLETAAEVARIARIAYNRGRRDQQTTTSALLRSLMA